MSQLYRSASTAATQARSASDSDTAAQRFWGDAPSVIEDLEQVRTVIRSSFEDAPRSVRDGLLDLASRPGKQLRPAFTVLAARAKWSGTDALTRELPPKIYRIAAAVEMLHMATLIHDDVIDRSDRRRGMSTLHTIYGSRKAVLMGDYLFSRCFTLVADDASIRNARLLAQGVSRMCEAQIVEGEESIEEAGSVRGYLHRVIGKTAMLFALSTHVGASENGLRVDRVRALRRAGYDIGVAFQIVDDLLDVVGSPEELGKPAGVDVSQGVASLPLVIACRRGGEEFRRMLVAAVRGTSRSEELRTAVEQSGAIAESKRYAECYTQRAIRELSTLPDAPPRHVMESVTRRLLSRNW